MYKTADASLDAGPFRHVLQVLLVLAFLTGGSSQISGWDDSVVQLLALPVLGWALWRISGQPASAMRNLALGVAALLACVPLLQMLSIPESLWGLSEARQRLAGDLAAVGAKLEFRWSLAPEASERAFLFLLPALAMFAGTLAAGPQTHRRLLRTVMLLALFSLLLAFVQLGVPAESLLNPFPSYAARFNGVFANQNHQGISLVVAIIIALAGMLAALPKVGEGRRQAWRPWVLGFVALFCLCALPLTQSRAAVLIGVFMLAAVPLGMGVFDRRHLRAGWGARAGLVSCLALVGLGVWATVGWMQVDMVDELRKPMREAALAVGAGHAPFGTGVGAFVPAFEQALPGDLLLAKYINHAHNEYAQWWMEAGWLGAAVAAAAFVVLGWLSASALRGQRADRAAAVAAVVGLSALLAHSWVDYPMRTGSLAVVAGVLAGIIVARAGSLGTRHIRHNG